uniref:Transmembrane protein n=1 Tax=Trypanosoma vivax (strain Y486) TaxID=1055687 RepID=G0TY55_TRYVY|nr:hypothetical protein, unlikely [Trypanosoma vivax Y486]
MNSLRNYLLASTLHDNSLLFPLPLWKPEGTSIHKEKRKKNRCASKKRPLLFSLVNRLNVTNPLYPFRLPLLVCTSPSRVAATAAKMTHNNRKFEKLSLPAITPLPFKFCILFYFTCIINIIIVFISFANHHHHH